MVDAQEAAPNGQESVQRTIPELAPESLSPQVEDPIDAVWFDWDFDASTSLVGSRAQRRFASDSRRTVLRR